MIILNLIFNLFMKIALLNPYYLAAILLNSVAKELPLKVIFYRLVSARKPPLCG